MTDQSAVDTLRAARRDLLDIMRRMDCQDLFDDAFYALVRYERAVLAASATDEHPPSKAQRESWMNAGQFARPAVPEALDVERLARAVRSMRYGCDKSADGKHGGVCGHPFFNTDNGYAEALAREYAALRSKEPTDDRPASAPDEGPNIDRYAGAERDAYRAGYRAGVARPAATVALDEEPRRFEADR